MVVHGLSLVLASRGFSLVAVSGLSIAVASLVAWAQDTGSSFWCLGLVAPQHVESSRASDQTHVLIGRFLTTGSPGKPQTCTLERSFWTQRNLLMEDTGGSREQFSNQAENQR